GHDPGPLRPHLGAGAVAARARQGRPAGGSGQRQPHGRPDLRPPEGSPRARARGVDGEGRGRTRAVRGVAARRRHPRRRSVPAADAARVRGDGTAGGGADGSQRRGHVALRNRCGRDDGQPEVPRHGHGGEAEEQRAVALRDHRTLHPAAGDLPDSRAHGPRGRRRDPADGRAARAGVQRRFLRLRLRRPPLRRRREDRLSEGDGRLRAAPSAARRGVPHVSRERARERYRVVKTIEVLDLPDEARELVRETEVKGARTLFQRNGRPVAMLVSYDEYLALRETIEIANDPDLGAAINAAVEEEPVQHGERVWLAASANEAWTALADHERALVEDALRRIDDDPIAGAPLFDPLKGLWTYRASHLRIVYRVAPEQGRVVVMSVSRAVL